MVQRSSLHSSSLGWLPATKTRLIPAANPNFASDSKAVRRVVQKYDEVKVKVRLNKATKIKYRMGGQSPDGNTVARRPVI